jgi:hypothetical protein
MLQFADDVTHSTASHDLEVVTAWLSGAFEKTKAFWEAHELQINTSKTQLIIFKPVRKKLPVDYEIILDGARIKPLDTVKLLGFTLDRHLTFGAHVDSAVLKVRSGLGTLTKAVKYLPQELLKLVFMAIGRTYLEYCNAVFASAEKTPLKKLDTVQRMTARIIREMPRDAHALLEKLSLEELGVTTEGARWTACQ